MEKHQMITGKRIRQLRTELGLTQEQFASEVGVTWSTVSRWENEGGKPSPLAMRKLAQILQDKKAR